MVAFFLKQKKVGVRMPANEIARRLIAESDCPLAAPRLDLQRVFLLNVFPTKKIVPICPEDQVQQQHNMF